MKLLRKDLMIYILFIIVSILFYFVVIPNEIVLRNSWGGDVSFTSRTFPYLIFIIIGSSSVIGAITTVFKMRRISQENSEKDVRGTFVSLIHTLKAPVIFMLLIIAYGLLFGKYGFILATIIVPPLFLLLMKCRKWQYYIAMYGFATIVYVVFKFLLRIPL